MPRILHAADVHLDSPLRGLERYEGAPVDEVRGATRRAFDRLVDAAVAEGVDLVLLAGDIYDGDWKDFNTGLFFTSRMARLRAEGIQVALIAGNHDAASRITRSLQLPDNVRSFSTKTPETAFYDDLGIAVHGQGFATRSVTENLAEAYPDAVPGLFNIGLLHTSLTGREGHADYAPCKVSDLVGKQYGYWALGHVHKREVVSTEPHILFPGNLQGRHARETGAKGCSLIEVEGGAVVGIEHRPLDVLRWFQVQVDAGGCADPDEVLDRARGVVTEMVDQADGRIAGLRLHIDGRCRAHARLHAFSDAWANELRAMATDLSAGNAWVEKVKLRTRPEQDRSSALERDDALGSLLRSLEELDTGDDGLELLQAELAGLRRKLPAELLDGADRLDPTDPEVLRGVLGEVKELLVDRLLQLDPPA